MIIKRDRYLKQVIDKKKNGMIKIITGIRRYGKSYLLNVLFRQHLPFVLSKTRHAEKAAYLQGLFERTYITDVIERNHLKGSKDVLEVLLPL